MGLFQQMVNGVAERVKPSKSVLVDETTDLIYVGDTVEVWMNFTSGAECVYVGVVTEANIALQRAIVDCVDNGAGENLDRALRSFSARELRKV